MNAPAAVGPADMSSPSGVNRASRLGKLVPAPLAERNRGLSMFNLFPGSGAKAVLAALEKSLAVIEFSFSAPAAQKPIPEPS